MGKKRGGQSSSWKQALASWDLRYQGAMTLRKTLLGGAASSESVRLQTDVRALAADLDRLRPQIRPASEYDKRSANVTRLLNILSLKQGDLEKQRGELRDVENAFQVLEGETATLLQSAVQIGDEDKLLGADLRDVGEGLVSVDADIEKQNEKIRVLLKKNKGTMRCQTISICLLVLALVAITTLWK